MQIIHKGLVRPKLSQSQLSTLPIQTLERLTQVILSVSANPDRKAGVPDTPTNRVLSFIQILEETQQYDPATLVAEDLALLEAHHAGSLHSHFFKPSPDWELLSQVLSSQGFRTDIASPHKDPEQAYFCYWLCRRLSILFPWTEILQIFPAENTALFPYLYRQSLIRKTLTEQVFSKSLLQEGKPAAEDFSIVQDLVTRTFPGLSQMAKAPSPVQVLVLVEGNTEELILPVIANVLGYDLNQEGILIQAVGGKNQMLQTYIRYTEHLAIPIIIILDKDAESLIPDLNHYQRPQDSVCLLEEGEFEDIYQPDVIVKTVNKFYQPLQPLRVSQVKTKPAESRAKLLQSLWQDLGLGLFDKVEFAEHLIQTMTSEKHLSAAMKQLIYKMIAAKTHDRAAL